ncbi:hypothetical protein LTS18_009214 [Coniosporium uncinatum]|uniref:Uncharacterized protein n=1 Tax=Coniosporium uncinatum TaxID=93489 RepID=A0ACC3DWM0_9PEZI|nr:hypothetical protein LTS18_009214 [Coniosporium uncinatum]
MAKTLTSASLQHLRLEKLKDTTLTCGHAGRHDIKVYGYVLADYSPVFRHIINDFYTRPVPEDNRIIDCSTFTPNVVHAMVRYMYYGDYDWQEFMNVTNMPIGEDALHREVEDIADRFGVAELKELAQGRRVAWVSVP